MLRGSEAFEATVAGSHQRVVKAEAWLAGRRIASDLPLVQASVSGDDSRFVRRTATLAFQEDPHFPGEALGKTLARPGCEVRVWSGVAIAGRPEFLPVFWGLSSAPVRSWPDRRVTVSSQDKALRVARHRFPRPRSSSVGMTVSQQIEALVRESIPRVRFVDESNGLGSTVVPRVVWERDRNDAVTKLAASVGCETFFRPDGAWVLRQVPSLRGIPTRRLREGVSLVDASETTDWEAVRNHWVCIAERADGLALVGESADTVATSPTCVTGPLGTLTAFYSSSLFTTSAQCTAAAVGFRRRSQGARVTVDFSALAHPGTEAGDRVDVTADGGTHRLILDSFDLDLFAATMTGRGRTATTLAEIEDAS